MASAGHIMNDESLRVESTGQVYKLISNKSNSPANTMKTLNSLFDVATKNATFGRERALIEWLQVCVKATVEGGLNIPVDPPSLPTTRGIKQSKPKIKKTPKDNDDAEWVEEEEERYELIGESDDDYVPSSDHDAVVPKTKKKTRTQKKTANKATDEKITEPKKTTRKKKTEEADSENNDQTVPSSKTKPKGRKKQVATLPLLDEGAGSKQLATYYTSLTKCDALVKGNFVKSFFFPSPDSFNVTTPPTLLFNPFVFYSFLFCYFRPFYLPLIQPRKPLIFVYLPSLTTMLLTF